MNTAAKKIFATQQRYENLFREVEFCRPRTIVEIGTWNGAHGREMIEVAQRFHPEVSYYGFDLFEELSDEMRLREHQTKRRVTKDEALRELSRTGARIELIQGDTRETLPRFQPSMPIDFVFIDGGHSPDTVRSDWEAVRRLMHEQTVVLFDDYYLGDEPWGARELVDELTQDPELYVEFLGPFDLQERARVLQIVKVTLHRSQTEIAKIPFYALSDDPPIAMTSAGVGLDRLFAQVPQGRLGRKAYLFCLCWWSFELEESVEHVVNQSKLYSGMFPDIELIFLCNSKAELSRLQNAGLRAILCNHNAFIDEQAFNLNADRVPQYHAIYNARLAPFKNHELAEKIEKLALVTYDFGGTSEYRKFIFERLGHASWLNVSEEQEIRWVEKEELCRYLNQALVGLCLSELEGAMYSSTEYMLCGLPVLSVPSHGGRDTFFHPDHALIIEPNADSVAEGVKTLIARKIPPEEVRARVLEQMQIHRTTFLQELDRIYHTEGSHKRAEKEWHKFFRDKLMEWNSADVVKKFFSSI